MNVKEKARSLINLQTGWKMGQNKKPARFGIRA